MTILFLLEASRGQNATVEPHIPHTKIHSRIFDVSIVMCTANPDLSVCPVPCFRPPVIELVIVSVLDAIKVEMVMVILFVGSRYCVIGRGNVMVLQVMQIRQLVIG